MAVASLSIESVPICPACNGPVQKAFEITVLGDTNAVYHNCTVCDSLIAVAPTWLERSYSTTIFPDPDTGALRRTLFVNNFIRRMRSVGLLARRYRSLDFGCGLGMLVSLQLDRGADAHGFDRYSKPRFAQLACGNEMPTSQFDLISAVEVIEHMTSPVDVLTSLRERLTQSGLLLITTELFERKRFPDPSRWHYLAPEHGQHIMLFSQLGLVKAAERAGLRHVRSIRWCGIPFVHLFCHAKHVVSGLRLSGLRWLNFWGERRGSSDLWA